MKVSEKFSTTGLFSAMDSIEPLPFREIITPTVLDILYSNNYGLRTVTPSFEHKPVEEIASMMVQLYYKKWLKLYEVQITEIATTYNYSETINETVIDNGTNTSNYTSDNVDSVNAYNDETFIDDKQNKTVTKNDMENRNEKVKTFTKQLLNGSVTDNLEKIVNYLQNNLFNDIIVKDINDVLTLSIFE